MNFSGLGLSAQLLKTIDQLGFLQPTPIQSQAIPLLLAGHDLLASAATGSGKTAAFLLPILHRLQKPARQGARALILTPTRELACQIMDHGRVLAAGTGLRTAAIYGGVSMGPQEQAFRSSTDILIATPGRLLDHLQYSYAKLDRVEFLVLDEGDRMLDMGFLPDIRKILDQVQPGRQTMLFSATLPAPIVELGRRMLKDPVPVRIEAKAAPARTITHRAFSVPSELKRHLLVELLRRENPGSVLVFTRTRHRANRLADFLETQRVPCGRIHGNRTQVQRTSALNAFRQGKFQVLVATDVAARGLDVPDLDLVVNFDVPPATDDYIHRAGRTGRAGATGQACTLIAPVEENDARSIERGIGRKIPRERLDGFDYQQKIDEPLEIPLNERIAAIRSRKQGKNSPRTATMRTERTGIEPSSHFKSRRDFRSEDEFRPYSETKRNFPPAEQHGGQPSSGFKSRRDFRPDEELRPYGESRNKARPDDREPGQPFYRSKSRQDSSSAREYSPETRPRREHQPEKPSRVFATSRLSFGDRPESRPPDTTSPRVTRDERPARPPAPGRRQSGENRPGSAGFESRRDYRPEGSGRPFARTGRAPAGYEQTRPISQHHQAPGQYESQRPASQASPGGDRPFRRKYQDENRYSRPAGAAPAFRKDGFNRTGDHQSRLKPRKNSSY